MVHHTISLYSTPAKSIVVVSDKFNRTVFLNYKGNCYFPIILSSPGLSQQFIILDFNITIRFIRLSNWKSSF